MLMALVIFSSVSVAEISIGADITSYVNSNNSETETPTVTTSQRQTNQTFGIGPQIGIFPSKLIEIAPFIRWSVTSSSTENTTKGTATTTTTTTERSQHSIEPGCGVYFHVVNNNNMLDFSLGPKLSYAWSFKPYTKNSSGTSTEYDDYYFGTLNFGVQTNIDLIFSDHFKARFFSNLFRLSLLNNNYKFKGSTTKNRSSTFVSDFRTILQPGFGFHFTF
jgi:hypothetical protein